MPIIHYITPFCTGNIGKGINDTIQCFNEDDWICLRDQDTLLFQGSGELIEDIVNTHSDYALIGCYMNRLRATDQLWDKVFSNNTDLLAHLERATISREMHSTLVKEVDFDLAGAFMLFPRSTWSKVGGFQEKSLIFDRVFTRKARTFGKVGIAEGLYIFHTYRMGSSDPLNDISHLKSCL